MYQWIERKKLFVIGEITAESLREYFADGFGDPNCDVVISSVGGDIGYMLAMLDDIDYYKRTTFATGICQSAAAVLATAGEGRRICTMDTLFRFIPPEVEKRQGDNGEIVEYVSDLRHYLHTILVARLAQRLKTVVADIDTMFDGEFISSTRAKQLGLIDEVISTEEKTDGDPCRFSRSQSKANCSDSGLEINRDAFLRS